MSVNLVDALRPAGTTRMAVERSTRCRTRTTAVTVSPSVRAVIAYYEAELIQQRHVEKSLRDALAEAHLLLRRQEKLFHRPHIFPELVAWREDAVQHIAHLTPRQKEIMNLVLLGNPSKIIAADLHISQRTVENHRAAVMKKTGSKSLPALARLGFAATFDGADVLLVQNGTAGVSSAALT